MSKLDDAFMKAYAKLRGGGTRKEPPAVVEESPAPVDTSRSPDAEGWADHQSWTANEHWAQGGDPSWMRPDDGVMNVASFIARTADGRSRGTATRPGDDAMAMEPMGPPEQPSAHAAGGVHRSIADAYLVDAPHGVRAPHFQPIAVDLAALDLYALPAEPARVHPHPELAGHQTPPRANPLLRADHPHPATTRAMHAPSMPAPSMDRAPATVEARLAAVIASPAGTQRVARPQWQELQTAAAVDHDHHQVAAQAEVAPPEPSAAEVSRQTEAAEPFHAAWEVDRFEFEPIVGELSAEVSALWMAADQLRRACDEGLRTLAVTSPGRGEGRSTLAVTLATMLATKGIRVALLDGDLSQPALADKLRLEVELGWVEAVKTGLSVEESSVHSVDDAFTVLPLRSVRTGAMSRPTPLMIRKMFNQLRGAFDLVVIDAAEVADASGWIPGADAPCLIDAALVLQDLRSDDAEAMQACLERLAELGIENVGLVENFAAA